MSRLAEGMEYVTHHWRPIVIVGALGLSAFICAKLVGSEREDAELATSSSPLAPSPTASPLVESTPEATATPITGPGRGETHPYTNLFYPYANPPKGYEEMTCFSIPEDGTAYGTQLLGGPDNYTLGDITRGVVFIGGTPHLVPLGMNPEYWDNLELVHEGDIGCSDSKK